MLASCLIGSIYSASFMPLHQNLGGSIAGDTLAIDWAGGVPRGGIYAGVFFSWTKL